MTRPIVVGVDGSEPSHRAVEWCAAYAALAHAPVIAVHAIDLPVFASVMSPGLPAPYLTAEQRDDLYDVVERDWCKPLADDGVEFRVELVEGTPTLVLMEMARTSDPQLVVVGRRGRGGFAELLLGSTSHQLAHHVGRPLVIVP